MTQAVAAAAMAADVPELSEDGGTEARPPETPALTADVGDTTVEQDDPPPVPKSFTIRPRELYASMEGSFENRRVRTKGRQGRRSSLHENHDNRLRELMGLTLDGDVYDPNLLEYHISLEAGPEQTWYREQFDGRSQSDSDSGFLHAYDISLDVLKSKPFSMHTYARHAEDRISRRFLPSLRENRTEFGASGLLIAGPTTTEFGVDWNDLERFGNRLDEDDEEYRLTRFYLDHTWNISDDQSLRVQYNHDREHSSYQGSPYSFDTRRDEFRLEHNVAFGSARQHRLDTFLRYSAEAGDLGRDEVEFVPRLTLKHNDQLETIYRYSYDQFDNHALQVDQHKFDVQALYRPSDRWRISLDGYGLSEREDTELDTQEFGTGFDVAYHRPTDLGELNVNVGAGVLYSETNGDADKRSVHREAHPLGGSRPIFLKEQDIVLGSIVAYNTARTRLYLPGVDYTIVPIGRKVRVARLLSGRITENEIVYFDYQYRVPTHGSIHAYRGDFLIEHAFAFGLTPYYGYEGRCENVESSVGFDRRRDNTHRHRIGTRYGKDWGEIGTEYEIFDDTWEPYRAWHLTNRFNLARTVTHNLDFSSELSRYWFTGGLDERRVWWFDGDVKDRIRLNEFLSAVNGLGYRWEEDTSDGNTHGVDAQCGLELVRGSLSVELTVEYDLLSLVGNRDQTFGVYLNVRRDLTELLPRPVATER